MKIFMLNSEPIIIVLKDLTENLKICKIWKKIAKGFILIDNIIEEISTHIDYLKIWMKKNPKLLSKNKKLGINYDIDKEIDLILKETSINFEVNDEIENADITNKEKSILEAKNIHWLQWYSNSCAFDSFIASFIFSIYLIISKNDIFLNKDFLCYKNNNL